MPFSRRTSGLKSLSTLSLLTSSFIGFVSAQGDLSTDAPSSSSPSGGHSGSSFHMEPINAFIFSLSIIFSIITALQLLSAAFNVPKHAANSSLPFCKSRSAPIPIALPSPLYTNPIPLYALGPIFPIALTMGTLCLLVTYILRASYWGVIFDQGNSGHTPHSFDRESVITSLAVFSYFRDAFFAMSLFSFVCFRVRHLCYCTCRGKFHRIKRVFDMVLVGTLFTMGTAYVGYRAHLIHLITSMKGDMEFKLLTILPLSNYQMMTLVHLRRANEVLLVLAAVEVFVSAVMLYRHAQKYQSAPDRKVAMLLGVAIAPLFLTYALYSLISQEALHLARNSQDPSAGAICLIQYSDLNSTFRECNPPLAVGLELGRVIVTCVTLSVIIWMLLAFSGASLVDALKGRSSAKGAPQERYDGQVYVHTHGLTYKV